MSMIDRRATTRTALARAVAAAFVMGVALAVASFVAAVLGTSAASTEPFVGRLVTATAVCAVVVAVILLLRRRWDRADLRGIGLTGPRSDTRGFLLGLGMVSASGAVVLGVLSLVGGVRWEGFDLTRFAVFLATNAVIALLLEAIPEEVAIRGYALTALRARYRRPVATALAIVTFLLVPPIALATESLLKLLAGAGDVSLQVAPSGEDPIVYYVMIAAFGTMLCYAREATVTATVWTCIGAHLAFLTINRIVLTSGTGVEVELPEVALLVFFVVYLSAAVIGFNWLRARADRRGGGLPNR
ncbi:CPBP family intramembrane metalloprotease [Natronosporangium hydrolyticum]|uniref:CPBP family intramembrane metalloprotease n=1 Tax=Natronosporangium hydrolyticum TaxID=2811111 RepID=A0A895YM22_9ACTN|nr:CPBP family glutamic-type intramembrane protease [Natronosporangium hydrolyticum]QSB16529.1 CPBP family intramembrane metalloprotease [Natronosporangium hydrolyticum]